MPETEEKPKKTRKRTKKSKEQEQKTKQKDKEPTKTEESTKEAKPEKPEAKKEESTALEKKEEKPKPKEYTPEEIEEISKKVETYKDNTPLYDPQFILSPDFGGTSNYEQGIKQVRNEAEKKLEFLRSNPDSSEKEIRLLEEDLKTLDYLYQNYHIGMNVFRTAKGGREKLRE